MSTPGKKYYIQLNEYPYFYALFLSDEECQEWCKNMMGFDDIKSILATKGKMVVVFWTCKD